MKALFKHEVRCKPLLHSRVMITDGHPSSEMCPLNKRMILITQLQNMYVCSHS